MLINIDFSELRQSPNLTENQPLYSFVEVTVGGVVVSDFTDSVSDTVMDFSFRRTAKQNTVGNPGDSFTLTLYDDTAIEIESVIYNIILETTGMTNIDEEELGDGTLKTDTKSGESSDSGNSDTQQNDLTLRGFFDSEIRKGVFGTPEDGSSSDETSSNKSDTQSSTNNDNTSEAYASDGGGNVSNIDINYGWVDSKGDRIVSNTVNGYFTKYSLEFEGASTILSIEGISTGTLEMNSPSSSTYREYSSKQWNGVASDIVKDVVDKTNSVKYTKDSIEETESILDENGKPKSFIMEGETPEEFIKNKLCEEAKSKSSGKIGYSFYIKNNIAYFLPTDSAKDSKIESMTSSVGTDRPVGEILEAQQYTRNSPILSSIDATDFDTDLFDDVLVNEGDRIDELPFGGDFNDIDDEGEEIYDPEYEDSQDYYGDDIQENTLGNSFTISYKKDRLLKLSNYRENGSVNRMKAVVDAANIIYKFSKKCVYSNKNIYKWSDMRSKKRCSANSCISISLQEAGVLRRGEIIGFRGWDDIYGMNSIRSAYKRHTIDSYFESPYKKYPYTKLPKEYREAGCVYIFRHSAGINMGSGYIYICNGNNKYAKVKGRDLESDSYFGIQMAIRPASGEENRTVLSSIRVLGAKESTNNTEDIMKACKDQADWMKNYTYDWSKWNPRNIETSKKYGTCVTYVACVLQRLGVLKSGKYIWHDGRGYGTGKVTGTNSKMDVKYLNNKKFKSLKNEIQEGDICLLDDNKSGVGGNGGHILIFAGKWSGDNPYVWDNHSGKEKKQKSYKYNGNRRVLARVRLKDFNYDNNTNKGTDGGVNTKVNSQQSEVKITGFYEFYSGQLNNQVISFSPDWNDMTGVGGEWLVDSASAVDGIRNELITLEVNANDYIQQKVLKDGQNRILGKSSSSLNGLSLQATSMWEKNFARQNTATMEIIGDPQVQTGTWIYVDVYTKYGFLHHTSGIYYVEEAEDSISDGSFTTSLQLRKHGNFSQYNEMNTEEESNVDSGDTGSGSTEITGSGPERIAAAARLLAWPTNTKKADYPSGKPTDAFKRALKKVYPNRKGWGKQPKVGASCDVFAGTCIRYSGVDENFPRGLREQIPYLAKSKKFYEVKKSQAASGDVGICPSHIYIICDGKVKNAHYNAKTYGKTENNLKHWLNKRGTKVYRAK